MKLLTRTVTNLPPGPRTSSLLGVVPEFARNPLRVVTQAVQDYGDCVLLPGPFGRNVYLLNQPDLIHEVLVTQVDKIEKPEPLKWIFRSSFGNGLFFSEGEFWRRQRKLAQPAFHHKRLQLYAEGMTRRAHQLLATWSDGQLRDIRKDMSATTLKVVVDALFQSSVEDDTDRIYQALHELGDILEQQGIANPLLALVPDWAPLPLMRRKRRASGALDAIVYRFIQEHRAANTDSGDLLSMLMLAEDEDGQRMSDRQLHDEVMTIFIAGHETTALTLTWAFALLAQSPAVEQKLHAELDAVLNGRVPTMADLASLPYAEMVIKETLRLYPISWLILRQATADLQVGPYRVPKGHQIWISPYTMHRHPHYFDTPEVFQPERFGPEGDRDLESRPPKFAYMPFGGGPRICIGNAFALMEARLVLATIAQRYRLVFDPGSKIQLRVGNLLGFQNGASMRVLSRS